MNNFFCEIPKKIEKEKRRTERHYRDYLGNQHEITFFLTPTTKSEVEFELKQLRNNKSIGPHIVPTKILKTFHKTISEPITLLINTSFKNGKFPTLLKLAKVIPTYKRGDKSQCTNYRPISLISNISKIIEKIIYKKIYSFLEQNKMLYNRQFGFRNNHSTSHALIEITEKIRKACDKGLYACGVFLGLKKAFDTVNHNILLEKLKYYGIRGVANDWLRSFLCERQQFTDVNGSHSKTKPITHGVPQGSVLGPLLFILFINDLHKSVKFSQVNHFADDTNLLLIDKSLKKINKHINHDLALITHWLRSNKISLNTSKTEIIIFRSKRKEIKKLLNFRLNGQKIPISTKVKYLGVILDQHLDWKEHLSYILPKLNRGIGLLSKIRHYVPKFLLRTLYFCLFNSHLIYCCQVWGQSKMIQQRLQTLQNKALRIINFKPSDSPSNDLYYSNKILKLPHYIELLNCQLLKEVLNNNTLEIFKNTFTKAEEQHDHQTRHSTRNSVNLNQTYTGMYGLNSIQHQAALSWNKLQTKLNIDMFLENPQKCKETIKKYFFNKYNK